MKLLKNIEQLETLIKQMFPEDGAPQSSVNENLDIDRNGQWTLCKGNAAKKIPEPSYDTSDKSLGEVQVEDPEASHSQPDTETLDIDGVDLNIETEMERLNQFSRKDIDKRTKKRDKRVKQQIHQQRLSTPKVSPEQLRDAKLKRRDQRRYSNALNEKNLIGETNLDHQSLAEGIAATQALKQLKSDTPLGRIKEGMKGIATKLKDLAKPERRTWQDDPQQWTDAMNTLRSVRQGIQTAHKARMSGAPKEEYMHHVEAAKAKLANLKTSAVEPENLDALVDDSHHRIGALHKMSNPKVKDPHTGKDTSLYDEAANARRKENNVSVNEELPQSMRTHKKYGIHGVEDTPSKQVAKLRRKSSKVRLLKPNDKGELEQVAELPKSGVKKDESI